MCSWNFVAFGPISPSYKGTKSWKMSDIRNGVEQNGCSYYVNRQATCILDICAEEQQGMSSAILQKISTEG